MSGHSKWAQIKRQKGAADQKRSKLFGQLAKNIAGEVRRAGGDERAGAGRAAGERARAAHLPNENIERAIKNAKARGGGNLATVIYEAYTPGGAAILIEVLTDNTNRTGQEIKHLLTEHGGNLAAPGAASWAFRKIAGPEAGWQAMTTLDLNEADAAALAELVAALNEHEDVKEIWTNATVGE